jgi:hypothetical protein
MLWRGSVSHGRFNRAVRGSVTARLETVYAQPAASASYDGALHGQCSYVSPNGDLLYSNDRCGTTEDRCTFDRTKPDRTADCCRKVAAFFILGGMRHGKGLRDWGNSCVAWNVQSASLPIDLGIIPTTSSAMRRNPVCMVAESSGIRTFWPSSRTNNCGHCTGKLARTDETQGDTVVESLDGERIMMRFGGPQVFRGGTPSNHLTDLRESVSWAFSCVIHGGLPALTSVSVLGENDWLEGLVGLSA